MLDANGPLAAAPLTREAQAAFVRQGLPGEPSADGSVTVTTGSDPVQIKYGLSPELRIQGWTIPAGTLVLKGGIARLREVMETPFDGIIGLESMANLTWRADYVAGKLTAYAGDAPAHDWQQCTFMTREMEERMPIVELGFEGNFGNALLDTGDDGDITLAPETFDALAKANKFERVSRSFSTDLTGRYIPNQTGLLAGFEIGTAKLPKLVVNSSATGSKFGLGLLEKMDRFELDFRHYRFCFDLPAVPKDSTLSTAGAVLLRSGDRYKVAALAPQGRLATSGVQVGDQISMVDQTSVAQMKYARLSELLSAPATSEVTVQRGNSTLALKLKTASK
jgi:hypothetical protein